MQSEKLMHSDLAVVVLTFNRAEKLARCLQSVSDSSVLPRELIVVDNASTDHTRQVAELYGAKYICTHRNLGCPSGRNLAIANASAPLIYTLDDDGWLDTGALAVIRDAYYELSAAGESVGALTSHVLMSARSNVVGKSQAPQGDHIVRLKNFSGGASLVVRDAFMKAGCYPDDFWGYGEEVDVSIRMLACGYKIFKVPASIMHHEPMDEGGRINKKFVYFNVRNTIFTVSDTFPAILVLPGVLWYAARWLWASLKLGNLDYALLGCFEGVARMPLRLFSRRRVVSVSVLREYIGIK